MVFCEIWKLWSALLDTCFKYVWCVKTQRSEIKTFFYQNFGSVFSFNFLLFFLVSKTMLFLFDEVSSFLVFWNLDGLRFWWLDNIRQVLIVSISAIWCVFFRIWCVFLPNKNSMIKYIQYFYFTISSQQKLRLILHIKNAKYSTKKSWIKQHKKFMDKIYIYNVFILLFQQHKSRIILQMQNDKYNINSMKSMILFDGDCIVPNTFEKRKMLIGIEQWE